MSPEQMPNLEDHGITPAQAEIYLTTTYMVSVVELLASDLYDHKLMALARIATGDQALYLLEDQYAILRAETLEDEKACAVPGFKYYWEYMTVEELAASRRKDFIDESLELRLL